MKCDVPDSHTCLLPLRVLIAGAHTRSPDAQAAVARAGDRVAHDSAVAVALAEDHSFV